MRDADDDKAADAQKDPSKDGIATSADDGLPAAGRAKPFDHWQGRLLTPEECGKVVEIAASCEDARDVRLLVTYATSPHGLVDDQVRRIACMSPHNLLMQFEVILTYLGPILLGYDAPKSAISPRSWRELPRHRDEDQVKLDVNRSFIYYPNSK